MKRSDKDREIIKDCDTVITSVCRHRLELWNRTRKARKARKAQNSRKNRKHPKKYPTVQGFPKLQQEIPKIPLLARDADSRLRTSNHLMAGGPQTPSIGVSVKWGQPDEEVWGTLGQNQAQIGGENMRNPPNPTLEPAPGTKSDHKRAFEIEPFPNDKSRNPNPPNF